MQKHNKTFIRKILFEKEGFTIVELLVVMVILGTLTTGFVSGYTGYSGSGPVNNLYKSHRRLKRELSYIRNKAVMEGEGFHLVRLEENKFGILNFGEEIIEDIIELEDDVAGEIYGRHQKVMFSRRGTVNGSRVELMDKKGNVRKITLSPGGRIR